MKSDAARIIDQICTIKFVFSWPQFTLWNWFQQIIGIIQNPCTGGLFWIQSIQESELTTFTIQVQKYFISSVYVCNFTPLLNLPPPPQVKRVHFFNLCSLFHENFHPIYSSFAFCVCVHMYLSVYKHMFAYECYFRKAWFQ